MTHFASFQSRMLLLGGGLFCVSLGLVFDLLPWAICLFLLLVIGFLLREAQALFRWTEHPLRRPTNPDAAWDDAAHRVFHQLGQERSRTRAALKRLRELQVVTQSLPDGTVVVDQNGDIEQVNAAAKRLLNLSEKDRGANLATLLRHPELVALLKDRYENNLIEFSTGVEGATEVEVRRFKTEDDRTVLLARDVTELNRLLSMRQEFIANVSHELRSPLTVIAGYIESLEDDSMDPAVVAAVISRLHSPVERLQALVDDLLLLTRLESSPLPPVDELQQVNVGELLTQIVEENRTLLSDMYRIELKTDSSARIVGQENELYSAFANLVSNAVRYSPNGGCIEVGWQDDATNGAHVYVTDEGVGIGPEHLNRLTERFYRVDLISARVRGGTGLGLAIVKHVLKRHNCNLTIDSELGSGSRFSCHFTEDQLHR